MIKDTLLVNSQIKKLVRVALTEDAVRADITSHLLIPPQKQGTGMFVARASGRAAGLFLLREVFAALSPRVRVTLLAWDGDSVFPGKTVAKVSGPLRALLAGERTALNFLCHLSGIATLTARFVNTARSRKVKILDTRKTLPGLRVLEKYAVLCGGGHNHRMDLSAALMIKDNHLEAAAYDWDFLGKKISLFRKRFPAKPVIIEVDRLQILPRILRLRPDVILLDNMRPAVLKKALAAIRSFDKKIQSEISGGVTLANIRSFAALGADRISIGALTHSARSLDFSLDIIP